jgi:hypothetical protein
VLVPVLGLLAGFGLGLTRTHLRWRSLPAGWTLLWVSLPPLLAFSSTWSGFAALAMLRYLVISLVGAIVLAALCHASFASRAYRVLLGLTIVASTLATSGMIEQWMADGRWIGDRNEPWNELVRELNERWPTDRFPVLLCAGLLEDAALTRDADPRLQEYCLFPVRGIYRLDATPLVPLPTQRPIELAAATCQRVADKGGAWVVVRASDRIARPLLDTLSRQLAARPVETQRLGNLLVARLVRD